MKSYELQHCFILDFEIFESCFDKKKENNNNKQKYAVMWDQTLHFLKLASYVYCVLCQNPCISAALFLKKGFLLCFSTCFGPLPEPALCELIVTSWQAKVQSMTQHPCAREGIHPQHFWRSFLCEWWGGYWSWTLICAPSMIVIIKCLRLQGEIMRRAKGARFNLTPPTV